MYSGINEIVKKEIKAFEKLLKCLDIQHEYIINNDIFKMEAVVDKIKACNIEVAKYEMERRNITKGEAMSKIVSKCGDEQLEFNYRKAKKLVEELKFQKETNEILIKQGLSYNMNMLQVINPDRRARTYGSYGKMR